MTDTNATPDDAKPEAPSTPSSHETSGQYPADEVAATHKKAGAVSPPQPSQPQPPSQPPSTPTP